MTLRKIPEVRVSHQHRGGSLKSMQFSFSAQAYAFRGFDRAGRQGFETRPVEGKSDTTPTNKENNLWYLNETTF
jgi:hypothetical protein